MLYCNVNVTALIAPYCIFLNCIQLFGYPAASVLNKLSSVNWYFMVDVQCTKC